MVNQCSSAEMLAGRLHSIACRHADWTDPEGEARDAALAELRDVAAGRGDLLGQQAGILLGFHPPGHPHDELYRVAARLLLDAGADTSRLQEWVKEGRRRARREWHGYDFATPGQSG